MTWVIINRHADFKHIFDEREIVNRAAYGPFESREEASEFNWQENFFPYPEINDIVKLYSKEELSNAQDR